MKHVIFACLAVFVINLGVVSPALSGVKERREARLAMKPCKACHHFRREKRKFGPHLVNVIGRPVASVDRFRYSRALKSMKGRWTEARLAKFINNPAKYAPGTNMKFRGLRNPAKARKIAAFLAGSIK